MSLRDKYTKEEWIKLEKLVFKKADKKSYDGSLPTDNIFLLDEIGQMKPTYYDAPPIPLNNNDEVGPFGKTPKDLSWDFIPLKPGLKFEYPNINKDMANVWNVLKDKINTEMKQYYIIINKITNKILEKKANGITPQAAIMSIGDYDDFHKTITYTHSCENNSNIKTSGVRIAGVTLLIYPTPNIEDGNIEIY